MKQPANPPSLMAAGLAIAAWLVISHAAAALLALQLSGMGLALAVILATLAGVILTVNLQRALWMANRALDRLGRGERVAPLPRFSGPMAGLTLRIDALAGHGPDIAGLRRELVDQTREAAAQAERNRLARDLHDSIKQQIFSISMSAAGALARAETDPTGAQTALADVQRSAQEAMVEMNALLQQLSPAPLEKVGLVQALRDQAAALGYRTGAEVEVRIGLLPDDDRLPPRTQESLFRIAQEALSNIARHARARHVTVSLGQDQPEGPVVLVIIDDGQGFDRQGQANGMGLSNIHQRAAALAGNLILQSELGQGTRLRVEIPLVYPIGDQEDEMTMQDNQTLNKTILTGAAGGILVAVLLRYPLFVLWPASVVADWPLKGSPGLGLLFQIAAAVALIGTGFLAVWWARPGGRGQGALFGALAGGTAGLLTFALIGGPAAGVAGAAPILSYGIRLPRSEAHSLWLIGESTVDTIWWTYGTLWAMLLSGTGLGAVGGLLVRTSQARKEWPVELRSSVIAIAAMTYLIALLVLVNIVSMRVYAPLQAQVLSTIPRIAPYTFRLSPHAILAWSIGMPLILETAAMLVLYMAYRAAHRANDPRQITGGPATAIFWAAVSGLVAVYLIAVGLPVRSFLEVGMLGSAVLHLAVGLLFARQAGRTRSVAEQPHTGYRREALWQTYVNAMLGSMAALMLILTSLSSASFNLQTFITPNLPWVSSWEGEAMPGTSFAPPSQLVQEAYLQHAQMALIVLVLAAAAYGIGALVVRGLLALSELRDQRRAQVRRTADPG